jgi:3-oxoacyl-[acyl-carrier protein] reductase
VHYHKAEKIAEDLVQQITSDPYKVRAAAFQADLSTYDGVRKLHADVVRSLGHPDVLFNNTGILGLRIGAQGNIQSVSAELFEETWRTNAGTHYLVSDLWIFA